MSLKWQLGAWWKEILKVIRWWSGTRQMLSLQGWHHVVCFLKNTYGIHLRLSYHSFQTLHICFWVSFWKYWKGKAWGGKKKKKALSQVCTCLNLWDTFKNRVGMSCHIPRGERNEGGVSIVLSWKLRDWGSSFLMAEHSEQLCKCSLPISFKKKQVCSNSLGFWGV